FGPKVGEHQDGVLLVQTFADVRGDFEKLIGFKEQNGNGEPPISRISVEGAEFYKIHDLFAVQGGEKKWLVGKSKTSLLAARDVLLGKSDSLKDANFLNYPTV